MHSVLNIFNVLIGQLQVLGIQLREDDHFFQAAMTAAQNYLKRVQDNALRVEELERLDAFASLFLNRFEARLQMLPEANADPRVAQARENLENCLAVLQKRVVEYLDRVSKEDAWEAFPLTQLRQNLQEVFQAIEKNSGGRYFIVYNLARQEPNDYFVQIAMESANGRTIFMPPAFQDTIRDLVANARKYTEPGGEIMMGLYDTGYGLRLVVEDRGRGIPAEELPKVVEYGYRASNAVDKPTMGGGFGLTKAHHVVHRHGGTLAIESEAGKGTRIEIEIPRPARTRTRAS